MKEGPRRKSAFVGVKGRNSGPETLKEVLYPPNHQGVKESTEAPLKGRDPAPKKQSSQYDAFEIQKISKVLYR